MKKEYIVYKLSECAKQTSRIDNGLFTKFNVKRGLRNEDGTGVLVGIGILLAIGIYVAECNKYRY